MNNLQDIPLPDSESRCALLQLNMKKSKDIVLDKNINWDHLIKLTEGFSGADITNVNF